MKWTSTQTQNIKDIWMRPKYEQMEKDKEENAVGFILSWIYTVYFIYWNNLIMIS